MLSDEEKKDYVDAEPNQLPEARTMYDILITSHQLQALLVYRRGVFLPFHRFHIHLAR